MPNNSRDFDSMSSDPKDNLQTHDPLGREFTTPIPGGPVRGRLNLIVGETQVGTVIVSLFKDDSSIEFDVCEQGDHGERQEADGHLVIADLEALTDQMQPYAADAAYYDWYEAWVGDMPFEAAVDLVRRLLAGWEVQEIG